MKTRPPDRDWRVAGAQLVEMMRSWNNEDALKCLMFAASLVEDDPEKIKLIERTWLGM